MEEKKRQPVFFRKGKRIGLCPWDKELHLEFAYTCMNDPEIHQGLAVEKPITLTGERNWFDQRENRKDDVSFAICVIETGEVIGGIGLHNINHLHGIAVTGTWIGRMDLWGKGYGTEAKMLLLEYAFNTLNLYKVKSEVYDSNERSQKCLKDCGYRQQGLFEGERFRFGRRVDVIQMAVFRNEFLPIWEAYREKYLG